MAAPFVEIFSSKTPSRADCKRFGGVAARIKLRGDFIKTFDIRNGRAESLRGGESMNFSPCGCYDNEHTSKGNGIINIRQQAGSQTVSDVGQTTVIQ